MKTKKNIFKHVPLHAGLEVREQRAGHPKYQFQRDGSYKLTSQYTVQNSIKRMISNSI